MPPDILKFHFSTFLLYAYLSFQLTWLLFLRWNFCFFPSICFFLRFITVDQLLGAFFSKNLIRFFVHKVVRVIINSNRITHKRASTIGSNLHRGGWKHPFLLYFLLIWFLIVRLRLKFRSQSHNQSNCALLLFLFSIHVHLPSVVVGGVNNFYWWYFRFAFVAIIPRILKPFVFNSVCIMMHKGWS